MYFLPSTLLKALESSPELAGECAKAQSLPERGREKESIREKNDSFIFLMMREYILIQCFPSHLILCNISSRLILIDGHERPGLYQVFIEVILIFKINIKILYPRRG
jgi:hypothetical protein